MRRLKARIEGTFDHAERRTPTNTEQVPHAPLTAAKLAELTGWIATAATGALARSDGGPTNLGSPSGFLRAYLPDGSEVVIDLDARDTDGDGLNDVTKNTSAAAAQIRSLVLGVVEHDL